MRRTIEVFLGDAPQRVGTIRCDRQGTRESAAFEYHADWLTASNMFAIDPKLQFVVGPQFPKNTRALS
jgi:serine/threonine-protein kinase HipA